MRLGSRKTATASTDHASADPITSTLIDTGTLSPENLQRIGDYCQRTGASFADAAIDLGLVAPEAVSRALAAHTLTGLVDPDVEGISRALVAAYDPEDPLTIQLRALRAILFNADDLGRGPMRVLVLTGIGTDETTGIAANLAVLVAQFGSPGLLVDANFTAPAQHVLFGIDTDLGVTSLLAGHGQAEAEAVETPVSNLDLLAAGARIGTLSETVERVSLVAKLRKLSRYAFAIIDAGDQPAEMVAALARGSDGVVLVTARGDTSVRSLRTLLDAMERNDVPVLGNLLAR